MKADVAASIQRMQGVPDKVKDAFVAANVGENGLISKEVVTNILQGASGGDWWTEERVSRAFEAAGGSGGQVAADALLSWIFNSQERCASASLKRLDVADGAAEIVEEEPCSPKVGRKKKGDKKTEKTADPWDIPVPQQDVASDQLDPTSTGAERPQLDPTSPGLGGRQGSKRGTAEKRARAYKLLPGEELYSPESHQAGVLLLRPDKTFAYIHDCEARFSEGVHGEWIEQEGSKVTLQPTDFGWCYQESFDKEEIIGVCHTVTLCRDQAAKDGSDGRLTCILPAELLTRFSWMDPTLPEE